MPRISQAGVWLLLVVLIAGATTVDTPDRTRNLVYDPDKGEWIEKLPPEPGTVARELYDIRLLIGEERYRKALGRVDDLMDEHGEGHALYPEMLIVRAEVEVAREDYDDALETLESFMAEFGGMGLTSEALRLQFVIAEAYLGGARREFLGLKILSGEDTALRVLDDISIDHSESPLAVAAIKTKGDYFFKNGDHALAELEYARMVKEYPNNRYYQYALGRTAESALASHAGVEYDESALIEAEERYREYRQQFPGAAAREGVDVILDGIREQRAEKEFITGQYYERTDHLRSAVFYYQSVVANWPDTLAAGKAARRLTLIGPADEVATSVAVGGTYGAAALGRER